MGRYFLEPENLRRYEGHDIVNLRASWALSSSRRIYANISNLTDRKYAERADFTRFSQERYFPGLPRAVQLGVELSW
jgi:outer membrane receptor protein involved in Fe transport